MSISGWASAIQSLKAFKDSMYDIGKWNCFEKENSSLLICQIMTQELMPSTANLPKGVQRDAPYAEGPLLSLLTTQTTSCLPVLTPQGSASPSMQRQQNPKAVWGGTTGALFFFLSTKTSWILHFSLTGGKDTLLNCLPLVNICCWNPFVVWNFCEEERSWLSVVFSTISCVICCVSLLFLQS